MALDYEGARNDWMGNNEYDISNQDAARRSIEAWRSKWGSGDANNEVLNLSNGGGLIDLVEGFNSGKPVRRTWTAAGNNGANPNGAGGGGNPWTAGGGSGSSQYPAAGQDPRSKQLYDMLMSRATQGLAVDRNDPALRAQSDAYAANEERARRNQLSDVAERSGPYANMRGEQRMGFERMGQRTGAMEAELVGREISARRQEIAQALQSAQGMLSDEQRMALQRELAMMDNAIRQQQVNLQGQSINNQNSQFLAQLGFNANDRSSYWDAIRSGLIS